MTSGVSEKSLCSTHEFGHVKFRGVIRNLFCNCIVNKSLGYVLSIS